MRKNARVTVSHFARLLCIIVASAMLTFTALPVAGQHAGPDGAPNPTASVASEQQLLQQSPRIQGQIAQPNQTARILMQPAGRQWDNFHEIILRWLGAIAILGMTAALAIAYLVMGRLRISNGRSGLKVPRFSALERFSHWLTAVTFVVLGLTGLNFTFGKVVLLPVVGPQLFSSISQGAKYAHNYVGAGFVVGLLLIVLLWIRDNIPEKVDIDWIRQGGGFIKSRHAPAGRFNAGEKLIFWFAFGAGVAISVSGYLLMFPFYVADIVGMQVAQIVHAVTAVLFVAVIIAHIYIGTIGMEGAFEAMANGDVDFNWAMEHHDIWLAQQLALAREERNEQS